MCESGGLCVCVWGGALGGESRPYAFCFCNHFYCPCWPKGVKANHSSRVGMNCWPLNLNCVHFSVSESEKNKCTDATTELKCSSVAVQRDFMGRTIYGLNTHLGSKEPRCECYHRVLTWWGVIRWGDKQHHCFHDETNQARRAESGPTRRFRCFSSKSNKNF